MIVTKKVSVAGAYAQKKAYEYESQQYEADIKDGDVVKILSGGEMVVGQYGEQHVFKVETRNGEKNLTLNQKTLNNLIDVYGTDTAKWIGSDMKLWVIKMMVSGKMALVVFGAKPDWSMDDEGNFHGEGASIPNPFDEDEDAIN